MENKTKIKIKDSFDSILRADYLSIDRIKDLNLLNDYYVDPFNTISSILQKQDNFISGRRGTGKTTALLKGYFECLKTLKKNESSDYFYEEKILPLYIDLSNCNDLFEKNNLALLEIHFVRQLIDSLKRQIEAVLDEKFLLVFKKENAALDDLDIIEKLLIEGVTISKSKSIAATEKKSLEQNDSLGFEMSPENLGITGQISDKLGLEQIKNYNQTQGLNIQEFLNKIKDIIKKAKIDYVYLFLDEYSDLNSESQNHLASLIKSFLGSKTNLFIKIGVITDRFDFGNNIIIGRDIFHIPLDLNEHVERLGGLSPALKKFEELIHELVEKRFRAYDVGLSFEEILKANKNEIISRIARESIGVTRTIGLILQNAWKQAEIGNNAIGLSEVNYGIRAARKTYFKQYEGAVKRKLIPGFYNDMWNALIGKALQEKDKHSDRPASHLLIDPKRNHYLNVFKENFIIHLLEESRSSKYGGNYNLYSIDYDICQDLNIKYAESKDQYTGIRFIYDDVLSAFDGYFTNEQLISYKCPKCGKIYQEREVSHAKVKRCFEDDFKLEEIIHQEFEITDGNFAEVEVKILGLITMLGIEDNMSAVEIANSVGCNRQKVSAWCSRVLAPKGDVLIEVKNGKNYYYGE
jgi:hypothetical protein